MNTLNFLFRVSASGGRTRSMKRSKTQPIFVAIGVALLATSVRGVAQEATPTMWFDGLFAKIDQLSSGTPSPSKRSELTALLRRYTSKNFQGTTASNKPITYDDAVNPPDPTTAFEGSDFHFSTRIRNIAMSDAASVADIDTDVHTEVTVVHDHSVRGAVGDGLMHSTWERSSDGQWRLRSMHEVQPTKYVNNTPRVAEIVALRRSQAGIAGSPSGVGSTRSLVEERLRASRNAQYQLSTMSNQRSASNLQSMKQSDRLFQAQLDRQVQAQQAAADDAREHDRIVHEQAVRDSH